MDSAIPSMLIAALLLVAATFMARTGLHSYDQLGASIKATQSRVSAQNTTRLSITGTSLNSGRDTLTLMLHNDGQTRLASYNKLDVILTYYTSADTRITSWLPFTDSVTADSWRLMGIQDDVYEPGILNPGETAQIEIDLGSAVQAGKTNLIVIGSEAGSTVSIPFTS
jgi:archaellum component FlaF (FlaF/FlaG flagellin family)